jgi:hypothetical protein
MLRSQAKALGLKVYRGMVPCRVSDRHGYLRLTLNNKCAACAQCDKERDANLRAASWDRIKAEALRELRREMSAEIAAAHRQARTILKEALSESMDKARLPERHGRPPRRPQSHPWPLWSACPMRWTQPLMAWTWRPGIDSG